MENINLSDMIIEKICAFNKVSINSTDTKHRMKRNLWALAFKTSGKTVYESNGKKYISDSNHVVLLPKGADYSFTCLELGECLMIEFEANLKPEHETQRYEFKRFEIGTMPEMIKTFTRLEQLWTFKKPAYKIKCLAGLYEILAKLDEAEAASSYRFSKKYDLIRPAVKYLEEHYSEFYLRNEKLAALCGISTVYLRKIFTGIYGISPQKYIQTIKIEKAKDMLISDYSSIADIADAVGFINIYHFSKTFKKVTGYTPTEFSRLMLRG